MSDDPEELIPGRTSVLGRFDGLPLAAVNPGQLASKTPGKCHAEQYTEAEHSERFGEYSRVRPPRGLISLLEQSPLVGHERQQSFVKLPALWQERAFQRSQEFVACLNLVTFFGDSTDRGEILGLLRGNSRKEAPTGAGPNSFLELPQAALESLFSRKLTAAQRRTARKEKPAGRSDHVLGAPAQAFRENEVLGVVSDSFLLLFCCVAQRTDANKRHKHDDQDYRRECRGEKNGKVGSLAHDRRRRLAPRAMATRA